MTRAVLPPPPERAVPLVRTTWVTKLLSGEHKCEWALWFLWRHDVPPEPLTPEGRERIERHDAFVNDRAAELREYGWNVQVEWENLRDYVGKQTGTILSGKADLTINEADKITFEECKTGHWRWRADHIQVLLYAQIEKWRHVNKPMVGTVLYQENPSDPVDVEKVEMDERLPIRDAYVALMGRVASEALRPVPDPRECKYCKARPYCAERADDNEAMPFGWDEPFDDRRQH